MHARKAGANNGLKNFGNSTKDHEYSQTVNCANVNDVIAPDTILIFVSKVEKSTRDIARNWKSTQGVNELFLIRTKITFSNQITSDLAMKKKKKKKNE